MLDTHLHMILIQRALGAYTEDQLHNSHNTKKNKNKNKNEAPHSVLRLLCVIKWQNISTALLLSLSYHHVRKNKGSTPLHDLNLIHFIFAHPHSYTYALGDAGTRNICCRGRIANSETYAAEKITCTMGFEFAHTLMHVTQACTCESWLHSSSKHVS